MSKIAEKKVTELGYHTDPLDCYEYSANDVFEAGVECYDQAMQDFLKMAERFIEDTQIENFICRDDGIYFDNERFIEQFKKYMQNG